MDPIIENLMAEPLYAIVAVLIAAFILYAIVKKIVKLALFMMVVFGAYLGYMSVTGREIPTDGEGIKNAVMEDVEKAGKTLKKKSGEAIDSLSWEFVIVPQDPSSISQHPKDGAYMHGMFSTQS